MSSLEWHDDFFSRHGGDAAPELCYELWVVGQDRTAWYNLPVAYIYRKGKRLYELEITDNADNSITPHEKCGRFTTLKAAKAMGIVLVRMEN